MSLDELKAIAAQLVADFLDYHELPNGQMLVVFEDGVWRTDANENKLELITTQTWMQNA